MFNLACCAERPGAAMKHAKGGLNGEAPPWQRDAPRDEEKEAASSTDGETSGSSPTAAAPEKRIQNMLRDNVKGVLVNKATRNTKMGVRLSSRKDGSKEGVEFLEVHPEGPLASVVRTGDVLLRSKRPRSHSDWPRARH